MQRKILKNFINQIKNLFEKTKVSKKGGKEMNVEEAKKEVLKMISRAKQEKRKLIFIGNGGSAAIAQHKALDFNLQGKIKAISVPDQTVLTCFANDLGFENIFSRQIENWGEKGDILIAISSSGSSKNIVLGVKTAQRKKMKVITFSGFKKENSLRKMGDLNFWVPAENFNQVEAVHLLLLDWILEDLAKIENEKKNILVVLDRDGTLIYDDGYFGKDENWKEKVRFYPGAIELIKSLNKLGKVIVCTNQIGIARGFYGPERVKLIHSFLDEILKKEGAKIDGWYFSPYVERKWAKKEGLRLSSPWVKKSFPKDRKPEIGMIKKALRDFKKDLSFFKKIFVIGDSLDDMKMALKVKGVGIFFHQEKNAHLLEKVKKLQVKNPGQIFIVNDLFSAQKIIQNF